MSVTTIITLKVITDFFTKNKNSCKRKPVVLMFAIVLFFNATLFAQHCGYDHSALIGVRPVDSNNKIIAGLRITFIENGKPLLVSKYIYKKNKYISSYKDTAEFWRNPPPNKYVNHNIREEEKRHFIQAGTDYIIITNSKGREEKGRFIKIEDIDGPGNGGYFSPKIVYVKPAQIQGLCGYPDERKFIADYLPLIVSLDLYIDRSTFIDTKTLNGYTFIYDKSPLAPCAECKGCYCQLFTVIAPDSSILFNRLFTFQEQEDKVSQQIDSFQVGDYNFDGVPDFRFFNGYNKFNQFYLYTPKEKTYKHEPLLSQLINPYFDFENKSVIGFIFGNKPHIDGSKLYKGDSYVNTYKLSGVYLAEVMIVSKFWYNPWNSYFPPLDTSNSHRDKADTAYYSYINGELKRKESTILYTTNKTSGDFKFELALMHHHAKTSSELDRYTHEIKVKRLSNNKLIYSSSFEVKKARNENRSHYADSIEIADYNFDGYTDFRVFNADCKLIYMVFDKDSNTFVQEPLLNKFDDIEFNFQTKNFIGDLIVFEKKDKNLHGMYPNNEQLKLQSRFYVFGDGLQYAKEFYKKYNHTKDGLRAEEKINYYKYVKYQLIPISESEYNKQEKEYASNEIVYTKSPFKFVLEKNTPGVELPAEKGYYANKILVYHLKDNKLIYSIVAVGNSLKEAGGCADSIQIADFNFDDYPDFRICNNSVAGKSTYYIYHKKRNTFIIEKTLTELNGLIFDFVNKTAKGSTDRKEFMGYPWNSPYQYYMETLQFEDKELENLTVITTTYGAGSHVTSKSKYINQKRMYDGDSLAIKIQKKNWLTKIVGPFKFEMEFNPEEYKPSSEKGSYVKVLNIYEKERRVGHFEMHGNYLKEVPHWLDSLEIADYNFDGFPDIRMYNSHFANGRYIYLLYNTEPDVKQFYEDTYFSLLIESEFIPQEKIMKGKIVEPTQTIFFFLKGDTLTRTTQDKDLSKPPLIEESIYKNGNRKTLRAAYSKLEQELKKEYGDYNFDGHEDFRQQSKISPYYWDVFIYNPKKETFVKDTLLSKFENFDYNKFEKKLTGYYRIKLDGTTRQTNYYQWSFTENNMVLYQTQVCYSKFPGSESYRCTISKLVDGKWIEVEQFGAE